MAYIHYSKVTVCQIISYLKMHYNHFEYDTFYFNKLIVIINCSKNVLHTGPWREKFRSGRKMLKGPYYYYSDGSRIHFHPPSPNPLTRPNKFQIFILFLF